MDIIDTAQMAQLVVAASVGYVLFITFFKPKAGEKARMRQQAAVRQVVRQRSERWAA